jgi:hypothetical protein
MTLLAKQEIDSYLSPMTRTDMRAAGYSTSSFTSETEAVFKNVS